MNFGVGITMTDGDLYEHFECVDPPRHRKFYELEVELALFYPKMLIRRWGKIGTCRPHELRCAYSTPEALLKIVEQIRLRRFRRGYRTATADPLTESSRPDVMA